MPLHLLRHIPYQLACLAQDTGPVGLRSPALQHLALQLLSLHHLCQATPRMLTFPQLQDLALQPLALQRLSTNHKNHNTHNYNHKRQAFTLRQLWDSAQQHSVLHPPSRHHRQQARGGVTLLLQLRESAHRRLVLHPLLLLHLRRVGMLLQLEDLAQRYLALHLPAQPEYPARRRSPLQAPDQR